MLSRSVSEFLGIVVEVDSEAVLECRGLQFIRHGNGD